MTAQKAFDSLVASGVWPALRQHGFRRPKYTFHREAALNWQVLNLQKSMYSDRDAVRFTVNVAVGLDRLRSGVLDWPDGKRPAESSCHLRERLGQLLVGRDTWWDVRPDTNLGELAEVVVVAIETAALPWLEERSDEVRLLELARDPARLQQEDWAMFGAIARFADSCGEMELAAAVRAQQARIFAD